MAGDVEVECAEHVGDAEGTDARCKMQGGYMCIRIRT